MDEEVLDMIDSMADEILFKASVDEELFDKKWLTNFLENRMLWVINYTHGVDALLPKD